MSERIVTFAQGPNGMAPEHQRKVVDLVLMHLGIEIVHIKNDVYVVRETAMQSESILQTKRAIARKSTKGQKRATHRKITKLSKRSR